MNAALTPRVHIERCTRYRFRYSACTRCADVCAFGALALSEEGVTVDAGKCLNCGLCVGACPTETFQSQSLSKASLVRTALEAKSHSVACSPSGEKGDTIIPCLGMLDAITLVFLLAQGVELTLSGLGHCQQCPHGEKAGDMLASIAAGVTHLRDAFGTKTWGRIERTSEKGNGVDTFGAGRRQLFRRLAAAGAAKWEDEEGAGNIIPAKAVRAAPHFRPLTSELLSRTVGNRELHAHPSIAMGHVQAQGACTGCELCERVCPVGALRSTEADGEWQLHYHGHCVGCGVCIEACQPGALRLGTILARPAEPERLHSLHRMRCKGCGRVYTGADAEMHCPVCTDDDQDFAAIFG